MAYGNSSYGGGSGAAVAVLGASFSDVAGAATRAMRTGVGGGVLAPGNDYFAQRFTMTSTSGTKTFVVENGTLETSEPPQAVTSGTGTAWFTWTPAFTGTATVSSDSGIIVDAYLDVDGTLVDVVPLGAPDSVDSVSFSVRTGETYAIRVYGTSPTDTATHTLAWSTALSTMDLTLASTALAWAPATVMAYIANDDPAATINLSFDGGATAQTETTDSEGNANFPLNIPVLSLGSHTVTATSSSGRTATVTFTVAAGDAGFIPPTSPVPPTVVSAPTARWQLQDPITGETWDFPINPKTQGASVLPRTLTPHWTTAHDGQPILFEGGRRARPWQITGHLRLLADLTALQGWQRPYRIYVTDDLGRSYVIKIRRVSSQPVVDADYPEHHTYTLTAFLFGPVPA